MQDSSSQQVELGASIHASFDELKPIDMALRGTVALGERQPGEYRVFVTLDAGKERLEFGQSALLHV